MPDTLRKTAAPAGRRMQRVLATLACLLALSTSWAQPVPAEWLKEAAQCPADVFRPLAVPVNDSAARAACSDPARLDSCMASCKNGRGEYCYWAAQALQDSKEEFSEALFQRSCKLGIASGCTNRAAGMMSAIQGTPDSQSCPARSFEKACAANDPWGCSMLAFILVRDKSDPANPSRALAALKKSCRYGDEDPACQAAKSLRKEIAQ